MKKSCLIAFALFLVAGGLLAAGHTLSQGPRMMGSQAAALDGTCTGNSNSDGSNGCACGGSCGCSGTTGGTCTCDGSCGDGCGADSGSGCGGDGQGNGGSGCGGNGGGCGGHLTAWDLFARIILNALRLG